MQQRRQILRTAALVSPLVLFALLTLSLAHERGFDVKEQISVLASDRVITITLIMPDNRAITVSQYDGEMIRTGPKEGEVLGITPLILRDGSVALEFFRVTKIIKKNIVVGEAVMSIGNMELNSTLPQPSPINLISSVQLISKSKPPEEDGVSISMRSQCPCCVTCGSQECCGLTVEMSCGSCSCF